MRHPLTKQSIARFLPALCVIAMACHSSKAPASPAALTAVISGSNEITLTWSSSAGASSYTLLRGTSSGGPYSSVIASTGATQAKDTGVVAGSTYYYAVQASSSNGTSAPSVESKVSVVVPDAPAQLTGSVTSSSATLNWAAVDGALSYEVARQDHPGAPFLLLPSTYTGTQMTDVGLAGSAIYNYVIYAKNGLGRSAPSAPFAVRTNFSTPVNLKVAAADTMAVLSWSPVASATRYVISRGSAAAGPFTQVGTAVSPFPGAPVNTTFGDTGLTAGQTYYWTVQASDGVNLSDATPPAWATANGKAMRYVGAYLTDTGVVDVGTDLTSVGGALSLQVGSTRILPVASQDGVVVFPNAPSASNLFFSTLMLPATVRTYVARIPSYGRPAGAQGASGTSLALQVSALDNWASGDRLTLFSLGAGSYRSVGSGLSAGATSYSGSLDFTNNTLIDALQGDVVWALQSESLTSSAGYAYTALKRSASSNGPNLISGGAANLALTLSGGSASTVHPVADWSAWNAACGPVAVPFGASLDNLSIWITAQPDFAGVGASTRLPSLVEYGAVGWPAANDLGVMSFTNPFPSAWTPVISGYVSSTTNVPMPGGSTVSSRATCDWTAALSAVDPAHLSVPLGLVSSPKIDGKDLTVSQINISRTPTLSWTAPAVGTANSYILTINGNVGGGGVYAQFAVTGGTQFTVPAGVLLPGQSYFAVITAAGGSLDYASAYRFAGAVQSSSFPTAGFQVQ